MIIKLGPDNNLNYFKHKWKEIVQTRCKLLPENYHPPS